MAVKLTPQEAAEKHNRRLKASAQDIVRGVQNVTEAPGKKAAAAQDKLRAKLIAAIDSGRWATRVSAVSLEEWQAKLINVGVPRIAAGIDAAADDMVDFYAELFPHQERIQAELKTMPDLTLEDSIMRATTWMRKMAEFKRR